MNAKRDGNHATAIMGVADDGVTLMPLLVDPITNELLVLVEPTSAGSTSSRITYKRDENRVPVHGGIGDAGEILPFLIDGNGNLLLDLI